MNLGWFKERAQYWYLRAVTLILSYCSKMHLNISTAYWDLHACCVWELTTMENIFLPQDRYMWTPCRIPWRYCSSFPLVLQTATAIRHGVNTGMFTLTTLWDKRLRCHLTKNLLKNRGEKKKRGREGREDYVVKIVSLLYLDSRSVDQGVNYW